MGRTGLLVWLLLADPRRLTTLFEEAAQHRRPSEPEDPLQPRPHQRMEDLAKRLERQPVAHHVFDDRRSRPVAEPVGVLPETIGTAYLLVHEFGGWLPTRDSCPPAQRNPEEAEPVVDNCPLPH